MTLTPAGFQRLPLAIAQLSLPAVLKCGQSFRWRTFPVEGAALSTAQEWRLALADRLICLRQSSDALFFRAIFPEGSLFGRDADDGSTLVWLKDYFQLDVDIEALYAEWSLKDPIFKGIAERFSGIRILRQDPWENVVSFICSQNNHISRITSMVQNLCIHFSPPLLSLPSSTLLEPYHAFPSPRSLSDPSVEATLRGLGFGYRAKYIQKTAAMLCEQHDDPEKWLLGLRAVQAAEAREELLKLQGVGPKVADCILLMSLNQPSIVPVDTHVYQIAVKHYNYRGGPKGKSTALTPKMNAEISQKMRDIWGQYAGWAHCVMFTADLKSFKEYGLPIPDVEVGEQGNKETVKRELESDDDMSTPIGRPTKRRGSGGKVEVSNGPIVIATDSTTLSVEVEVGKESELEGSSLGERIKARSRTRTSRQGRARG